MSSVVARHQGDVVRPQDFDGDRHRWEAQNTALAFGAAAVEPVLGESPVDFDTDDAHWVLPGHTIDLGSVSDGHVFGDADDGYFVLDELPPESDIRRYRNSDAESETTTGARDYLMVGADHSVSPEAPGPVDWPLATGGFDSAAGVDCLEFSDLPIDPGISV